MLKRIYFSLILLIFSSFGMLCFGQALPAAQILSGDTAYCETGVRTLKIKFKGTPPFGIIYTVKYSETDWIQYSKVKSTDWIQIDADNPDTTWTTTLTEVKSYEVTIDKVFDSTIPQNIIPGEWVLSQGTNNGTGKMSVRVDHIPTTYAGSDASVCNYQATLNADPLDLPTNKFEWVAEPAVLFDDNTLQKPTVTAPAEGDYKLKLKEIAGTCSNSDSVMYHFKGHAKAELSGVQEICVSGQVPISIASSGNYPIYVRLSDGTTLLEELIVNSSVYASSVQANGNQSYSIGAIKDKNDCITPQEDRVGLAHAIDLLPHPIAGVDQVVCGKTIELSASTDKGIGHWEGAGVFENPNSANTLFTANDYGAYDIAWVVDNKGCIENDSMLVGEFFKSPVADAGSFQRLFIESGQFKEARLDALIPEYGFGTWFTEQNGISFVSENDPKTKANGLPIGKTEFRWVVENGVCLSDTAFVSIEVKGFTYSNAFTPNGDGINDTFEIFGLLNQPVKNNELKIFDVNGRLLYSQKDYDNTWNGKDDSGKELPSGAYYYLFSGDGIESVKSYLIIKRE